MGSEILRYAQDDRAVLPAALWPTRAHVRLRLMRIEADKSAVGAINRPLHCSYVRLPTSISYTYFLSTPCSLLENTVY